MYINILFRNLNILLLCYSYYYFRNGHMKADKVVSSELAISQVYICDIYRLYIFECWRGDVDEKILEHMNNEINTHVNYSPPQALNQLKLTNSLTLNGKVVGLFCHLHLTMRQQTPQALTTRIKYAFRNITRTTSLEWYTRINKR